MVAGSRTHTSDDGISLVELIAVLALIGVVISAGFAGLRAVYAGNKVSDRQAWVSREIGQPLARIEAVLTQNIELETATPYSVTVLVDQPRRVGSDLEFDQLQRHVISATPDGRIVEQVWSTDTLRQNTALISTVSWSTNNANQALVKELFGFLDGNGSPISASLAPQNARSVVVRLVTVSDDRSFEGTRTIFFRNR